MPTAPLRIALAQCTAVAGDVGANIRTAIGAIEASRDAGVALVVFPELSLTGYDIAMLAERGDLWFRSNDPRLEPLQRACAGARVTAVVGAPLRTPEGHPRIASLLVDERGDVSISHKEHVHSSEAHLFESGTPAAPFDVRGWRVALAVCFDTARPRHAEAAALGGADVYVASSLYDVGEERRADLHFGARAMDYRMFAALANYAGTTGGHESCGGSGVWGPTGDSLARVDGAGNALVIADLDPQDLARFRATAPK